MDHQLKFCELTGLSENRKYQLPSTSEALLQSGRYYREAFDKVAAKGELHAERIRNEIQPDTGRYVATNDQEEIWNS